MTDDDIESVADSDDTEYSWKSGKASTCTRHQPPSHLPAAAAVAAAAAAAAMGRGRGRGARGGQDKTAASSRRAMTAERREAGVSSRRERMLMRPWLQQQADDCTVANMTWYDDEHTMIRIPWKHGSRSGWTLEDCELYCAWARHTGTTIGLHS